MDSAIVFRFAESINTRNISLLSRHATHCLTGSVPQRSSAVQGTRRRRIGLEARGLQQFWPHAAVRSTRRRPGTNEARLG